MFFGFSIIDIIDILLVAAMLYYFYRLMKESGSLNVFIGILLFFFTWILVSRLLQMRLMGSIMDQLMSVGTIALIVIFHDEVRNFFKRIGSNRRILFLTSYFARKNEDDKNKEMIMPIVMACVSMSQQKIGALIVIEKEDSLNEIASTGEAINANVGQRLIEAIFFKNAPLHDGAIVIRGNRIVAAQCILPVSHNLNIPKKLGLRHRAAMGVAEKTDALAVIVSEETGAISVAKDGKFMLNLDAHKLEEILSK
ncbi:MAG: diadenylate cyclase CdaA [Bacteroidaceae bacterium]|nr:diadenylate cyclase CdaA [Bacteroidaceae bacterium]MBR3906585.1 diadenylate cyclase CdaA [Bacteroidaceae bacterium]